MTDDTEEPVSESWANILAKRSPEGREVVEQLWRAEKASLAAQERCASLMLAKRPAEEAWAEFEQSLAEVRRLQTVVYNMARQ